DRAEPEATATGAEDAAVAEAAGSARIGTWGIDAGGLSAEVRPGNDFFVHVNAGWLDQAEIPAGFSRFGSFTELSLEAEERVEQIIAEAAAADASRGDPRQQIGDLYAAFLDTETIEARGIEPIRATLEELIALDSHEQIAHWMGRRGTSSLVGLGVTQDAGNPERYIVQIGQSGLGLPDREYYERDDEPFPAHRAAYVDYIESTLERAGIDLARERAEAIMALETAIAANHWTRVQRRDRQANYNLMTREELAEFAPGFAWDAFLEARQVGDVEELVVATDAAIAANAELFAETAPETWAAWHAFHWVNNHAPLLSEEFEQARFEMFDQRLRGVEEQREREKRAIQFVSGRLGEVVGQVYVQRHFPPEYRAQMETLVEYLRRAFAERLETLDWMDEETRVEARAKLAAFDPKIGYPDRWRDYSTVEIDAARLVESVDALGEWAWQDSISRLGEPVRDWEWFMTPQTVNAYYSSTRNEIVFPAAILQPPFFDPFADPAVNFGAIGGVIGHEMGHGF
ncbi:MAG: M13 family metallopeptidase, partial [Wenzhouxiangellaceae bacterium]